MELRAPKRDISKYLETLQGMLCRGGGCDSIPCRECYFDTGNTQAFGEAIGVEEGVEETHIEITLPSRVNSYTETLSPLSSLMERYIEDRCSTSFQDLGEAPITINLPGRITTPAQSEEVRAVPLFVEDGSFGRTLGLVRTQIEE